MNSRFPVLSALSWVLRIVGGLFAILGLYSSLKQAVALAECLPGCSVNYPLGMMNAALLIPGLFALTVGESIGVLFAIEANTRKVVEK